MFQLYFTTRGSFFIQFRPLKLYAVKYRKGGYSTTTANDYVNPSKPVYSLSTELKEQRVFENGRPTSEIKAYKAWFSQEGLG